MFLWQNVIVSLDVWPDLSRVFYNTIFFSISHYNFLGLFNLEPEPVNILTAPAPQHWFSRKKPCNDVFKSILRAFLSWCKQNRMTESSEKALINPELQSMCSWTIPWEVNIVIPIHRMNIQIILIFLRLSFSGQGGRSLLCYLFVIKLTLKRTNRLITIFNVS